MLRWNLALAAVLVLLAVPVGNARAARTILASPQHSWGVTYLGAWHVAAHAGYDKAVYALGAPTSVRDPESTACTATWSRLGLDLHFENFGVSDQPGCRGSMAQSATISGRNGRRQWRTRAGLRVGDSLRRLNRLYPNARHTPAARVVVFQESPTIGDGSIVTARLRYKRVVRLELWIGGAGE